MRLQDLQGRKLSCPAAVSEIKGLAISAHKRQENGIGL